MEIKYILVFLVVVMLSGCAAKQVEQPDQGTDVTPPVDEVQQPVEPEVPNDEQAEEDEKTPVEAEVEILRGGFNPQELAIPAGSTVSFVNTDDKVHIVSILGVETSPRLEEGDVFEYEFQETGIYSITDAIFGFRGTITVEE